MNALILVDLDNLYGWWEEQGGAQRPTVWDAAFDGDGARLFESDLVPGARGRLETPNTARVALAFNDVTARHAPHTTLLDLANGLAAGLSRAQCVGIEPALVRRVPQAADWALCRLLGEAPDDGSRGPFDIIWLVSQDRGLRRAMGDILDGRPRSCRSRLLHWWMPRGWTRRLGPRVRAAEPATPGPAPSARLDTPAACAWASVREVELQGDIPALAVGIGERPHAVTQIGPTWGSTRGVARLARLLDAPAGGRAFGAIAAEDGVELRTGDDACAPEGFADGAAPGLVHLVGPARSFWSRLPFPVLARARAGLVRGLGGVVSLDDARALRDVPNLEGAAESVVVRFTVEWGDRLVAEVERLGDARPEVWWWVQHGRMVRSVAALRVEGAGARLAAEEAAVDARAVRYRRGDLDEVVLVTSLRGEASVRVDTPISAGRLGTARSIDGNTRALVWAAVGPVGIGAHSVVRIQRLDQSDLPPDAAHLLPELERLPIVVPQKIH